uniref:Reverse transcriptase n=1 Tax=Cannabis sativa TaxID=3483 RepID=A0A803PAA5_CANSA
MGDNGEDSRDQRNVANESRSEIPEVIMNSNYTQQPHSLDSSKATGNAVNGATENAANGGSEAADVSQDTPIEDLEVLRNNFLESMTLDLEPDFELTAEIVSTGVLVSFLDGKGVSKSRLKTILGQIWRLKGLWKFKTLKPGVWGIFFDKPEDCADILRNRPWIINGKLLNIREWLEDGDRLNADMKKAMFWVLAFGLPTPYLNGVNSRTVASKAGRFIRNDHASAKTNIRRGFLKFQVEIDTSHQLSSGFFLDVKRGRKEWVQFRYFKLPKLCYNCGYLGHDKKSCFRSTAYAYPPEGAAVPAYGPWMKAESAVFSCFNTRNQLEFFREAANSTRLPANRTPADGTGNKDKGKRPIDVSRDHCREPFLQPATKLKPEKKVIRVIDNSPGAILGKNLKVVEKTPLCPLVKSALSSVVTHPSSSSYRERKARSASPRVRQLHIQGNSSTLSDSDILKKFSSRPPPNPADNGILTTIMAQTGPTYEQMIEKPHVELCSSRQPHKHPEPTHFPWPIYAEEIGLTEELMGPPQVDKYEPAPTLFHDPEDVSTLVHPCPQPRKRKASLTLVPYVQRLPDNTMDFSLEVPKLPEFSSSLDTPFKMGSGASSSSLKNDKRRRKGSRSRLSASKKGIAQEDYLLLSGKFSKFFLGRGGGPYQAPHRPMKCLSWNCRGLARDPTSQALKVWVKKYNPDCIFLMETKVQEVKMKVLARNLGFVNAVCISSKGLSGGSCFFWNNNLNLVLNYATDGFFEALVWDFQSQMQWKLYAIYGTPYAKLKEYFWSSLEKEVNLSQVPWVLIGDLNCIGNQEEKIGGSKVTLADTRWLRNFTNNTGCVDLRFIGSKFTWQNQRYNSGLIRERLDRALCSVNWLTEYASSGVLNLPISISDHAPIILDTHLFAARGYVPFRFFEAWSWESSCRVEVSKAWRFSSNNASASLLRNISSTRKALQAWKRSLHKDNGNDIKSLERRLEWIQMQPISTALKEEESKIQADLLVSWSKLESMWRQKSRETWLALGDRNTRFFHSSTVIRRRRNSIWAIKDKEDKVWKDKSNIARIINSHFLELFSSSQPTIDEDFLDLFEYRISAQSNEELVRIPSDKEIKGVVFNLHPLKAPGPDGFSGCFFRKYWDIVGSCLCSTIKEAFHTGYIDPKLNSTFICLIPKVEFPLKVDQFRPISLCNFAYKVIAKILSNRLRPLMEDLVSPFQSAFIPGRWIAESSILTQELVHKIRQKRGRGGLMAIKLDMHKAYDKMEWSFLDRVLNANGFNESSRRLLMACVTSVSYSVLLNGYPLKKFNPKRGLRQGDPLSPFLFLLCQEVLSKLIVKAEAQRMVHGIKISQSALPISHLMFADDTILFARANENDARTLLKCLSKYEDWSGQSCSKTKSGVLFSRNLNHDRKNHLLNILRIDQVRGDEKHLGNPFIFKRRKKDRRLKESMNKKLEGWKMKLLSYAGRLTLLKSVASSMPVYAMSTNKIPLSCCRQLDALMRKYWWLGNVEKDRFMALKAWDQICTPKASGGLGLRRCEDMNKALMSKLAWNLASNIQRPWVKCLLSKYCKHENFWSVNPKNSDSSQWKGILESRDILYKGSLSIAASGSSIDFWRQPWIPWMEYQEFSDLMQQIRTRRYTISSIADVSIGNHWNAEIIYQIFGQDMGNLILQIPRIPNPFSDQIFWKHNQKGRFSVKSAYCIDQSWRFAPERQIWKWIWDRDIHPKISVFLWRILNEAIPTKNRLPFVRDKDCSLCGGGRENAIHLFRDCSFAKAIWLGGYYPLIIDSIPGDNMINFLESLLSSLPIQRSELLNFAGCVFSEIWNQRNALHMRSSVADPLLALQRILNSVLELNMVCENKAKDKYSLAEDPVPDTTQQVSDGQSHQPMIQVAHVMFTDASWADGLAGLAAVGVDRLTACWFVNAQKSKAASALEAELQAILLALNWAVDTGWQEVHVLSDSLVAVSALNAGVGPPDWKCANIFFSIINASKKLSLCKFFYINRRLNSVADGMAKSARVAIDQAVLYQGEGIPPVVPIFFSS